MAQTISNGKVNKVNSPVEFRNGWTIPIVFIAFSLAFTAVMLYVVVLQSERNKYYEQIEAEVISVADYTDTDGDDHHEVFVRYVVDGEKYRQKLNYWNEDLKIGDTTTIRYDIRDPNIIKTTNEYTALIIIEVSLSLVLYIITTLLILRKIKFDKNLKNKQKKQKVVEIEKEQPVEK